MSDANGLAICINGPAFHLTTPTSVLLLVNANLNVDAWIKANICRFKVFSFWEVL